MNPENRRANLGLAAGLLASSAFVLLIFLGSGHHSGGNYLLGFVILLVAIPVAARLFWRSRPDHYNDPDNDYGTARSMDRHQEGMKALRNMYDNRHRRRRN